MTNANANEVPMTDAELLEIKARLAAADEGPWEFENGFNGKPYNLQRRHFIHGIEVHPVVLMKTLTGWEPNLGTAELIAHAPRDITNLLAEVERLKIIDAECAEAGQSFAEFVKECVAMRIGKRKMPEKQGRGRPKKS